MDQLGAILAQVVQNNHQLTESLAQQQELLRMKAAKSQSEMQALTKMVLKVADRGRRQADR